MEKENEKEIELSEKHTSDVELPEQELPDLGERFQIHEQIGMGAMGSVYRATDKDLQQEVAVKVLRSDLARDAVAVKRFEQEVEAASKLDHANLVAVYLHGRAPKGLPYLSMDLIKGSNLSEVIKKEGKLDEKRVLKIALQICDALEHAHAERVIHRDLKPSNVIIEEDDSAEVVKVADFGIAKVTSTTPGETGSLTGTGDIIGSPYYMSPEQCQGEDLDESSDIYSLACLMVEALTGKPPYEGVNSVQIILGHLNEPLTKVKAKLSSVSVSSSLIDVLLTCLSKTKQDRYKSVKEFAQDLRAISSGNKPVNCKHLGKRSNNRVAVALICGVSVFLVFGLFGAFMLQSLGGFGSSTFPGVSVKPKLADMRPSSITDSDIRNASISDRVVRFLDLKNSRITDSALRDLENFPNLTWLTLNSTRVSDSGMSYLTKLRRLKSVRLERTTITDEGLEKLVAMPSLERLYLKGTKVSDRGLVFIGKMTNLKNLCLTETQISDQGLKELEGLPLVSIHLVSTRVSDKGLKSLGKIKTLETVRLTKTPITGSGLNEIASLPELKYLNLDKTDIVDKYLLPLEKLQTLQSLRINNTEISDKALDTISKLSALQTLKLQSTEIGDNNIEALGKLKELRALDLTRTNVTDRALDAISKFPKLEILRLSNTKVTDKGILKLAANPNLKQLFLKGCDLVSPQGMQELETLKPDLRVE